MADKASKDLLEKLDTLGMLKKQISDVLSLEDESGERLLKVFNESRRELLDRLASARISEFQIFHIRGVLAQIDAVISTLKAEMKSVLTPDAEELALSGVSDTVMQLETFSEIFSDGIPAISINETLIATETSNLLLNKYTNSVDFYGQDLVNRMHNILIQSVAQKKQYSEIVRDLASSNGLFQAEAWRVNRIARTELHNIYDTAKFRSISEIRDTTMPDLKKMSYDPIDHRTGEDSKAVAGQIQPVDKPFVYKLKGKTYSFMNHPNRPNDRGMTLPYRSGWEVQDKPK